NIWDWIHEMSGPGPYDAYGQTVKNFMVSLCPGPIEEHPVVGIFSRELTADPGIKPRPCFFVDKRWVRYDPLKQKGNFPTEVDLNATDFGISWQFASYQRAEFGVGAGWATFNGLDGVSRRKFTLTLPRIIVMPLALIPNKILPNAATRRYL